MVLRRKIEAHIHPALIVLGGFLLLIIVGMLLLKLPQAATGHKLSWIDGLFTSTSAVCVTGLIVVDTGSFFSVFGQFIILLLIQMGGLGVMTLSVALYRWLGRNIPFKQRKILQELFTHTPREDIFHLVSSVIRYTVVIEATGFILLFLFFMNTMSLQRALWVSAFHAVSAFCNAGFSLFSSSLMNYETSIYVNSVIAVLIILGGIGFPVLYEMEQWIFLRKKKKTSLHLKTVLTTTLLLIISGAIVLGVLEYPENHDLLSWKSHILSSLFQSITARTAGFNTVDIAVISDAGLAILIFLMFVGASPGSCGGGVKTTTLALLVASSMSKIRARNRVVIGRKSLPDETVNRSLILVVLAISGISFIFFLLLATNGHLLTPVVEERGRFLPFLFETVSAFGTVGLSMGITGDLNAVGKALIATLMVVGRVGVLTFSYIFIKVNGTSAIEYAEENIMIG
ncbi:MAG: hypothetical protein JXK93_04895 [Sphaerochaetaceae bacterium]|nr:hypothetical protein [Sphaerochaetaceae bacterium]